MGSRDTSGRNFIKRMIEDARTKTPSSKLAIGVVASFNPVTYKAKVKLPLLDDVKVECRVGTPWASDKHGARFRLKAGDEVLVGFPDGSPQNSEGVIICRLYGKNSPPSPTAMYIATGGDELMFKSELGDTVTLNGLSFDVATHLVNLGVLASFGVLLSPAAAKYNAHVHVGNLGLPTLTPLPVFFMIAGTDWSLTVKAQV